MNTFQKVIKYTAIAFAIVLTIGIISGIVGVISGIVYIFDDREEINIDYSKDFTNVEQLDIKHKVGKLNIKLGTGFRVEATNVSEDFKAELVNGSLVVEESNFTKRFFGFRSNRSQVKSVVTIYVPEDFYAKRIKIDSGAGVVNLEDLSTDRLIIDAGVGDLYGRNLTALRVDVNAGVGNMNFINVNFTDVDFDSGVGNISIEGDILGKSEFDCGVGEVTLKLIGEREDYALRIDTGIGSVRVDGKKISSDYNDTYNTGNIIRIDGGIGEVDIRFGQ